MTRTATLALALVFAALVAAHAQTKPIGLMGVTCASRPAWASFGQLAEWDDFQIAADCSRLTGMAWVLALHHADREHVAAVRARASAAGLLPYVLAVHYREEPYEHLRHGMELPATLRADLVGDAVAQVQRVRDHWSEAHATIHAVWPGVLVAFIAPYVNDSLQFGADWYAPPPAGIDVLVLDPYATASQTFAQWPGVAIQHAINTTTLPIAIVPQWFTMPGTTFAVPRDFAADYWRWLAHPRVVALWGFAWESRPAINVVGLRDMPALRASVEARIK